MNWLSKWWLRRTIKKCLVMGNNADRNILLTIISDTCYDEYTEDNWPTRIHWLIVWLLENDRVFQENLRGQASREVFIDSVKANLADSVDKANQRSRYFPS